MFIMFTCIQRMATCICLHVSNLQQHVTVCFPVQSIHPLTQTPDAPMINMYIQVCSLQDVGH